MTANENAIGLNVNVATIDANFALIVLIESASALRAVQEHQNVQTETDGVDPANVRSAVDQSKFESL